MEQKAILRLYRDLLRTSIQFKTSNIRAFIIRRTNFTFRRLQIEQDENKGKELIEEMQKFLEVNKRQVLIQNSYYNHSSIL